MSIETDTDSFLKMNGNTLETLIWRIIIIEQQI